MNRYVGNDPWGHAQPPALQVLPPLPIKLITLVEKFEAGSTLTDDEIDYVAGFDVPELDEVKTLLERGWEVLEAEPQTWLAPAAWPAPDRTWLPDRRPRFVVGVDSLGEVTGLFRADPADLEDWDSYADADAISVGLAPPPRSRVWLLRSPINGVDAAGLLEMATSRAFRASKDGNYAAPDVYRELRAIFTAS